MLPAGLPLSMVHTCKGQISPAPTSPAAVALAAWSWPRGLPCWRLVAAAVKARIDTSTWKEMQLLFTEYVLPRRARLIYFSRASLPSLSRARGYPVQFKVYRLAQVSSSQ